jgi:hypothetical protein
MWEGSEWYLEKGLLDLRVGDELVVPEVLDQVPVGPAGAAPGHVDVGPAGDEGLGRREKARGDAAESGKRERAQDQRDQQLAVRQC